MRYVKAFSAAVLAALTSGGIVRVLPGVSESTTDMVGAADGFEPRGAWFTAAGRMPSL